MKSKRKMNEELKKYEEEFNYLETLRQSGITNMYGAAPYLAEAFCISKTDARNILNLWMKNYETLMKYYGWTQ
jgi:hypothetical protein